MITFTLLKPNVDLGFIPSFLSEEDPRPAAEQIDTAYSYGGGWMPLSGWVAKPNGAIQYPGDPVHKPLAEAKLRDEVIRFYQSGWLGIFQPDGSFEVSRLD